MPVDMKRLRSTVLTTAHRWRFRAHDKCAGSQGDFRRGLAISSLPIGIRGEIFAAADCISERLSWTLPGAVPPIGILTSREGALLPDWHSDVVNWIGTHV